MKWLLLGCCLAACGRVGFESERSDVPVAADAMPDLPGDAAQALVPCGLAQAIPTSVMIAGETFRYTSVANQTTPVASTNINVIDRDGAGVLASATSDAAGTYSVVVELNGAASSVVLEYAPAGYWTTRVIPDVLLDRDIVGPNMDRWRLGDGPIWGDGEMGTVYGSVGLTVDSGRGTINIAVRDCAEAAIEGVVIDVQPPPERLSYIDASGAISSSLTSTVAPYSTAIALNAQAGPTHITATKAGLVFLAMDLDVPAGKVMTYPAFHPLP